MQENLNGQPYSSVSGHSRLDGASLTEGISSARKCSSGVYYNTTQEDISTTNCFEMPAAGAQNLQVFAPAMSNGAKARLLVEENKQCFTHAYISDMAKVQDVLRKKCGDLFRIQV